MFNFTTTRILNSNVDPVTGGPVLLKGTDTFLVTKHAKFAKANVVSIYKAAYSAPELAQATFDLSKINEVGIYRLSMYIRLQNSENELYANSLVFKGKPIDVEFNVDSTDLQSTKVGEVTTITGKSTITDKVIKIARKYQILVNDTVMINLTGAGTTTLTATATDQYQRFKIANIQKFDETQGAYVQGEHIGEFVNVIPGTIVKTGKEGFGTYEWILHNLRLPTMANTRWNRIVSDDTPILGAQYNQYIVKYKVDRGVMGGDSVGMPTQSITTHVFFVNTSIASLFETGLAAVGTIVTTAASGTTSPELSPIA